MLPQQLFITLPHLMFNNLLETADSLQDSLYNQTQYILDYLYPSPYSEKLFFQNLFRIQKDINNNFQETIDFNFHYLNNLLFEKEIPDTRQYSQKEQTKASTSEDKTSRTSNSAKRGIDSAGKTSSDSRYGKTRKSNTTSKSKKQTGKKGT